MNPHPADPRLTVYAEAVMHRMGIVMPPGSEPLVPLPGRQDAVSLRTLIVEVLRAADSIGLLLGSATPPEPSATDIEEAAQLLADGNPRYGPQGWGWQRLLDSEGDVDYAYAAGRRASRNQARTDALDRAYGLLRRHVRRADHPDQARSATVGVDKSINDGGGLADQGVGTSPADCAAAPSAVTTTLQES